MMKIGMKLKTFIAILITSIVIGTSVVNGAMYLPTGLQQMLSDEIVFYEGSNIALVNNVATHISDNEDTKPFRHIHWEDWDKKERFVVPLKFVAKLRGAEIIENGNTYTIKYGTKSTDIVIGSDIFTIREPNNEFTTRAGVPPIVRNDEIFVTTGVIYYALNMTSNPFGKENVVILRDRWSAYDEGNFGFAFREEIEDYMKTIDTRTRILNSIVLYQGSSHSIVNGTPKHIDSNNKDIKPILVGNWNIVPLRFISENLGAIVEWDANTSTAIIELDGKIINITKGKNTMLVAGKGVDLQTPAAIYGESMYVPLRAVSEAFGKKVFFDRKVIIISDPDDPAYKLINDKVANSLSDYFKFIGSKVDSDNILVMYQGSPYTILNKTPKQIDNKNKDIKPILLGDKNIVPLRFISESLGATVDWEPNTFTAIIKLNNKTVKITKDKKTMTVDGKTVNLEVAAKIYNESMYVPLRAISEAFGKKVFYDRKVIIISDTDIVDASVNKDVVDNLIKYFNNKYIQEEVSLINITSEKSMVDDIIKHFENKIAQDSLYNNKNSLNNRANGSLVVKQGDWIYYTDRFTGLWKIKEDGSNKVKLVSGAIEYINVYRDWIYFLKNQAIYKVKISGTNNTEVFLRQEYDDDYMQLYVLNDKIYYTRLYGNSGIRARDLNGEAEHDDRAYHLPGSAYDLLIIDNNAYYINAGDGSSIYRINLDSGIITKANDQNSDYVNVMDGYIYYSNRDDGGKIYKVKDREQVKELPYSESKFADTYVMIDSEDVKINDDKSWFLNAYKGWIYYSNANDGGRIYKIKPDGTGRVKVNNRRAQSLNIIEDWIYYYDGWDMYRIKTNGTQEQKL